MVAVQRGVLKNLGEFWSFLGSKLKASLTVAVTIRVPVFSDIADFAVTSVTGQYAPGPSIPREALVAVGGQVLGPGSQAVANALVDILDADLTETTDSNGDFVFDNVPVGTHTVRAVATGYKLKTQSLTVPGMPNDYVITLTPL